jgi:hypothetical protein
LAVIKASSVRSRVPHTDWVETQVVQETRIGFPHLGDEESVPFSKSILSRANHSPLDLSATSEETSCPDASTEVSLPAVAETRLGVVRLADRVCEATRQAALEGAGSALSILAANQSPALPDAIRDLANRALARTAIMQSEFDRFRAVTRHAAWGSPRAR